MTEQQIQYVIAAQNGDVKSFEQLYAVYYAKVYGFARMILKNERDAEDVLEETFITAWRKLGSLESPPAFAVWIQVIAKNLCNMQLRRKNIVILLDAEQDMEDFDTEETEGELLPAVYAERTDLRERLGAIIESLSDVQRRAIVLYYFNELSVDEISEIMECSPGTVKSRLFLARKAIKAEIEEQEHKSGQKFYGVAGIPTLPFGDLVRSHMESFSIGRSMANTSLDAIKNSIAKTNIESEAAANAETQQAAANAETQQAMTNVESEAAANAETQQTVINTAVEGAKMGKSSAVSGKIIAIIAIAAVAAVLVVVLVIVPYIGGQAGQGDDPDMDIVIDVEDEEPIVEDDDQNGENDETDVTEDIGGPAESDDVTGGGVIYDYNDLSTAVADIPNPQALDEMYILLTGYWVTEGDPYMGFFIGFVVINTGDHSGAHGFDYGLFETEFGRDGRITGGHGTGAYEADLVINFPAVPGNEMFDGYPETTDTILIDIGGLYDATPSIKVKKGDVGDGGWYTYVQGGATVESAYETWSLARSQ